MPQSSQPNARRNSITSDVSAIGFLFISVGVRAPNDEKRQDGGAIRHVADPLQTPLAKARWALEAGDVRRAHQLAAEAARAGPESERAEAEALLRRLGPDTRVIAVAAVVLLMILIAAWVAILRPR